MKKLKHSLLFGVLTLFVTSCMEVDNFDEPDAHFTGRIIDKTTGENILADQGAGRVKIWEKSFSLNPGSQTIPVKQDGTFNNTKLFKGTYDVVPEGAWWPADTIRIGIGKKAVHDFEVTPYLKLIDLKTELVDTCFFQTFGIPVLKGNPNDLINSNTLFVSESFARRFFGDADPIGKVLILERKTEMIVRGVYRDIPENTMFKADFVVSVHKEGGYKDGAGWGGNDIFYAVFRTGEASDIEVVNDNIQRMVEKYMPTEHNGWKLELSVIPLATKHQTSSETTKRLVIYGFLGFSIFFVAIMNYMLIVIATLGRRAKSVGVHKCNGANNGNIFSMFMMETGIIVLVSILVCAFIIFNARDLIEDLLSVRLASLFTWGTLWVPLLVVVLLFLLAGVLPGRIFSHIPVTQVFRRYTDGKKGWKRSLLFIQFTGVSFVLGLLLVTLMQYSHLMNRDMGINTAGLVEAESWLDIEIVPHMRDEIRRQPMVESVATASHSVLGQYWTKGLMGSDGKRIGVLNMNYVDFNYPDVVGITIIEGKPMTHAKDLLVNEMAGGSRRKTF